MSKKDYRDLSHGHPGETISPIYSWARATNMTYNALLELTTLPLHMGVAIVRGITGYDLNRRPIAFAAEDDRSAVSRLPHRLTSLETTRARSGTKSAQEQAA